MDILNYYWGRFHEMDFEHRLHFVTRLNDYCGDEVAGRKLQEMRQEYVEQDLDAVFRKFAQKEVDKKSRFWEVRKDAYAKYPKIQFVDLALSRVLRLKGTFGVDRTDLFFEYVGRDELEDILNALASDDDSVVALSTVAVTSLAMGSRLLYGDTRLLDYEKIFNLGERYNLDNEVELSQLFYLYTHCPIYESNLYQEALGVEKKIFFRKMLVRLDKLVLEKSHMISLDNKLEFLVCANMCDYFPESCKSILEECSLSSKSAEELYLVDTNNSFRDKTGASLNSSEHRNALYILAHKVYCHKTKIADLKDNLAEFEIANRVRYGVVSAELFRLALQGPNGLLDENLLGGVSEWIWGRYKNLLSVVPDTDEGMLYSAAESCDFFAMALKVLGLYEKGWRPEVRPEFSRLTVILKTKRVYLPDNFRRNADNIRSRIVHEVLVHAYRSENGATTGYGMFASGTPDYLIFEEGLAILLECAVAKKWQNEALDRARQRYITAGLICGLDGKGGTPRNARQTLYALVPVLRERFSLDEKTAVAVAEDHVENAFRDLAPESLGVYYKKLQIYFAGLLENLRYFGNSGNLTESLDAALLGAYNHTSQKERDLLFFLRTDAADKNC